ncbi:hypothetical protein HDV00_001399 [Rhizophlyctis rosea]|nr:hypothetical protein HDV00_001399 [Rhizophlyctis rosea]
MYEQSWTAPATGTVAQHRQPRRRGFAWTAIPLMQLSSEDGPLPAYRIVVCITDGKVEDVFDQTLVNLYLLLRFRHDVLQERHRPAVASAMLLGPNSFYLQKLIIYNFETDQPLSDVDATKRNMFFRSGEFVYITPGGEVVVENLGILKGFLIGEG